MAVRSVVPSSQTTGWRSRPALSTTSRTARSPGTARPVGRGRAVMTGRVPLTRTSIGTPAAWRRCTARSGMPSRASSTMGRPDSCQSRATVSHAWTAQAPIVSASASSGIAACTRRGASSTQVSGRCRRQFTG